MVGGLGVRWRGGRDGEGVGEGDGVEWLGRGGWAGEGVWGLGRFGALGS